MGSGRVYGVRTGLIGSGLILWGQGGVYRVRAHFMGPYRVRIRLWGQRRVYRVRCGL